MARQIGKQGERQALSYLESLGHRLLATNYRTPDRRTEIDIITYFNGVVHFVEVKAWRSGNPLFTQNQKRINMVRRAAIIFLSSVKPFQIENETITSDILNELCHLNYGIVQLSPESPMSFDLIWIKDNEISYHQRIF